MVLATRTMSYWMDIKAASSTSYTSTPTQTNFQSTSISNLTNETSTLPSTSNTTTAPPPKPPTDLRLPPLKPLFFPASTVWWGPVTAIVKNAQQTTDSAGHTSFSYNLLLPSGLTRIVQETRLKTSAPPAPPTHANIPTLYPPFYVPDVAPLINSPYIQQTPAQQQPQVPPTPAPLLPPQTFTPQTTLPQIPSPTSRLRVPSLQPSEQPIQQSIILNSFMDAMDKQMNHYEQKYCHYEQ